MKKAISLLLALIMAISTFTVLASAVGNEKFDSDFDFDSLFAKDFEITDEDVTAFAQALYLYYPSNAPYSPIVAGCESLILSSYITDAQYELYKTDKTAFMELYGLADIGIFESAGVYVDNNSDSDDYGTKVFHGFDLSSDDLVLEYLDAVESLPADQAAYLAAKLHCAVGFPGKRCYNENVRSQFITVLTGAKRGNEPVSCFEQDINFDGEFSSKDIRHLKRYIVDDPVHVNTMAADQNKDGDINSKDVRALKALLVG